MTVTYYDNFADADAATDGDSSIVSPYRKYNSLLRKPFILESKIILQIVMTIGSFRNYDCHRYP
jgi:hypothetical protein